MLVLQAMTTAFTPWLQQPVEDLEAVAPHRLGRLGAVGHAGGVAEVDGGLVRQALVDGAGHGEPADAGIEDADRARDSWNAGWERDTLPPTPPGTACSWRSPGKSARWAET